MAANRDRWEPLQCLQQQREGKISSPSSSRDVPYPVIFRVAKPRLNAPAWISSRLMMLSRCRRCVRGMALGFVHMCKAPFDSFSALPEEPFRQFLHGDT